MQCICMEDQVGAETCRIVFFFIKSVQYGGNHAWICGILTINNE